jgi:hypothetical protein
MVKYYVFMFENGTRRPAETVLRRGKGDKIRSREGMNLTNIYCKHFCKCQNVPLVQL